MVVALGSQAQTDTLELDAGTVRDPAQVADEAGAEDAVRTAWVESWSPARGGS